MKKRTEVRFFGEQRASSAPATTHHEADRAEAGEKQRVRLGLGNRSREADRRDRLRTALRVCERGADGEHLVARVRCHRRGELRLLGCR